MISFVARTYPDGLLEVTLPVRTVSEANCHQHWRVRQRRAKDQRHTVAAALRAKLHDIRAVLLEGGGRYAVTLTRVSPGTLDSDNLAGSQKHVRDGVADALGIDNRDERVAWLYAQRRGEVGQYGIVIAIREERET